MELSSKYNTEIAESRLGAQQGFGTCIWQMQMLYGVFQIQVSSQGLALNKGFLPAIIDSFAEEHILHLPSRGS